MSMEITYHTNSHSPKGPRKYLRVIAANRQLIAGVTNPT